MIPSAKIAQFFNPPPLKTFTNAPRAPPPVSSPDFWASAALSRASCKTVESTPGNGIAAPTLTIMMIIILIKV